MRPWGDTREVGDGACTLQLESLFITLKAAFGCVRCLDSDRYYWRPSIFFATRSLISIKATVILGTLSLRHRVPVRIPLTVATHQTVPAHTASCSLLLTHQTGPARILLTVANASNRPCTKPYCVFLAQATAQSLTHSALAPS